MQLPCYQISTFTNQVFGGNPAAVVPLKQWLSDQLMQLIATENKVSKTAFFVSMGDGLYIRWFTPKSEVKLCCHATLATAFVLFNCLGYEKDVIAFESKSGRLSVSKNNDYLVLNFPTQIPTPCDIPSDLINGLGQKPQACLQHEDLMAIFDDEKTIAAITPDHHFLQQLDLRGVIVTAPSKKYDFVARFFAPKYGIPEDPVTGSAYTQLAPYWSKRLGKNHLRAQQMSPRGGEVFCELADDRVLISGQAVQYFKGCITLAN